MQQLYLVRHAEPTTKGVFIGATDSPLSAQGLIDAKFALELMRVDHVYVSPLKRALQSAAFIQAPQTVIEDLREIYFGDWEGLNWAQICAADLKLAEKKMSDWFGHPAPHGEKFEDVLKRAQRALDVIRQGPALVAVMGHAVTNAAIHYLITGQPPDLFEQEYLQIHHYEL